MKFFGGFVEKAFVKNIAIMRHIDAAYWMQKECYKKQVSLQLLKKWLN